MLSPENPFTRMQKAFYVEEAAKWTPENRDPVVGSFEAHNAWEDYELLFEGLETVGKEALDFGCGPGRNIVKYARRFARIDGVDISLKNLSNARVYTEQASIGPARQVTDFPRLYLSNGVDLKDIASDSYDVVFSTITLQHIPVHEIRLNFFQEFFRVLRPGGWFTAQMGFGETGGNDAEYHENRYDAEVTNGGCDTLVRNSVSLHVDLTGSGFRNPSSVIRPVGPCDRHSNWIFFRAQKPKEMT